MTFLIGLLHHNIVKINKPELTSKYNNSCNYGYDYMNNTKKREYPPERKKLAEKRVNWVKKYYENLGYRVTAFSIEDNTQVDVIAENEKEVLGIEVQNWKKSCYLSMNVFKGYKAHWRKLESELRIRGDKRRYRKLLFYSFIENIAFMFRHLEREGVELKEFGYQDIPSEEDESIEGWRDE